MASLDVMTPSSNSSDQELSRGALIALVVGSMVGSGIFALPSSFGRATGGLGALIAWGIAGVGMLMLAFVFQTLSRRKPDLDTLKLAWTGETTQPNRVAAPSTGFAAPSRRSTRPA
jgi:amino acid transporter